MITTDHYLHPRLNWDLIALARQDKESRLEALKHIRAVLQLSYVDAKFFLDNSSLYFDPRQGAREPTKEEYIHELERNVRILRQHVQELQKDKAIALAERDVYREQLQFVTRLLKHTKED